MSNKKIADDAGSKKTQGFFREAALDFRRARLGVSRAEVLATSGRWLVSASAVCIAVFVLLLAPKMAAAAVTDCKGLAVDGQADCVLPTYAPTQYTVCDIAGSFPARANAWSACSAELGIPNPILSEEVAVAFANCFDKKLVPTGGVVGAVPWLSAGTYYNDNLCTSGTVRVVINGVLVGTKGSVGTIPTSTEGVYIGLMPTNVNTSLFKGYIDDVRITKGVARYISNFTPPALTNVDTAVPAVTSTRTYDAAGRVLSDVDPNGKTTTYAYYSVTSFTGVDPNAIGHTVGDLQSITNAAGHVTQYTQYDRAGRVRQMIDPKGVVTDISYTPRGWVSTVTTTAPGGAGRVTSYTYDGVGQLTGVTQPDGTTLSYSYDAAHRLVGVTDAKGNSVTYTLDNAGNRIAEEIKDPTGVLQRSIGRSFDALNRVQQVTGAAQ